ncbi:DUF4331 family protein [Branchiibius sp. NY16-3462-2]|uniref:DUF4331 family protein n=1 Tax=Branchiibius sp. NY16-3462-2 TaxID=1807500 RepID=UPI000797DB92|nr:DUF4331 family protein [Branchiibius sp. NY16-3462-2]KYH45620.1 hypothetical protein AZH51_18035 [Branchiibius sp. NY16-3462-2]
MSHHNSGPRAHQLPIADITDAYAFPAPGQPGHLALVVNTVPYADPNGFLSEALIYRFRIRPLTTDPSTPAFFTPGADDTQITIDATFDPPTGDKQQGHLAVSTGATVDFVVNQVGEGDGLRVFAGPRWDPFFSDALALQETITTGKLSFKNPGAILSDGKNVFSVVVELDLASLLGEQTLVAVVAETVINGKIPIRWERFGRPELENAVLGMKTYDTVNRDLEIRDLFNAEDAFNLGPDYLGAYRARLNANLAFWDGIDGSTEWPLAQDGTHPLTELLLADYLIVDYGKPFAQDTFLEIERAVVAGEPHQTCGGRSLNDDCMDTLYTYLMNGAKGPRISDHVDGPTRRATQEFPYLVEPNPNPPSPPQHH